MKAAKWILHNWLAKLICLILAIAIWWVLLNYVLPGKDMVAPPRGQQQVR